MVFGDDVEYSGIAYGHDFSRMRFDVKRTVLGDRFRGPDAVSQVLPGTVAPPGTTLAPPGPNVVFEGLLDRPDAAWAGNVAAPLPDARRRRPSFAADAGPGRTRGDTLE